MPEEDEEDLAEEHVTISQALAQCCNTLTGIPDERQFPSDLVVISVAHRDYSGLVACRTAHQTRQAAEGVHTQVTNSPDPMVSLKVDLIWRFQAVLHEEQEHRVGTGVERRQRWISHEGAGTPLTVLAGNAANAAQIVTKVAGEVSASLYNRLQLAYYQH
jgi:hypothetical protein